MPGNTSAEPQTALAVALARCRASGLARPAAAAMTAQAPALARSLSEHILAEVAAYRASGNPQLLPDLSRHAEKLLRLLCGLLDGSQQPDLAFVQQHARHGAAQRFPIDALLQAYQCITPWWLAWAGQALASHAKGRWLQALAALGQAYAADVSVAAAAAYVQQTRLQAEAEGHRRTELLGLLLGGVDEADTRAAGLLKRAGYLEQRLSFCVALVQATDPLEMDSPARAQRIVDALTAALAPLSVRLLVGMRQNLVTAVIADLRRVSGWTAPQAALSERLRPALLRLGPAVLVGLSTDQPSTAFIPRGQQEALVALDLAHVGERLVAFSQLPIRRLLIHRGAAHVQAAMPPWLEPLRAADAKAKGALLASLRALADADINVQLAARTLEVHPNTLYARLQRVTDLTGLNAQRYHDLGQLLLAADCARL